MCRSQETCWRVVYQYCPLYRPFHPGTEVIWAGKSSITPYDNRVANHEMEYVEREKNHVITSYDA